MKCCTHSSSFLHSDILHKLLRKMDAFKRTKTLSYTLSADEIPVYRVDFASSASQPVANLAAHLRRKLGICLPDGDVRDFTNLGIVVTEARKDAINTHVPVKEPLWWGLQLVVKNIDEDGRGATYVILERDQEKVDSANHINNVVRDSGHRGIIVGHLLMTLTKEIMVAQTNFETTLFASEEEWKRFSNILVRRLGDEKKEDGFRSIYTASYEELAQNMLKEKESERELQHLTAALKKEKAGRQSLDTMASAMRTFRVQSTIAAKFFQKDGLLERLEKHVYECEKLIRRFAEVDADCLTQYIFYQYSEYRFMLWVKTKYEELYGSESFLEAERHKHELGLKMLDVEAEARPNQGGAKDEETRKALIANAQAAQTFLTEVLKGMHTKMAQVGGVTNTRVLQDFYQSAYQATKGFTAMLDDPQSDYYPTKRYANVPLADKLLKTTLIDTCGQRVRKDDADSMVFLGKQEGKGNVQKMADLRHVFENPKISLMDRPLKEWELLHNYFTCLCDKVTREEEDDERTEKTIQEDVKEKGVDLPPGVALDRKSSAYKHFKKTYPLEGGARVMKRSAGTLEEKEIVLVDLLVKVRDLVGHNFPEKEVVNMTPQETVTRLVNEALKEVNVSLFNVRSTLEAKLQAKCRQGRAFMQPFLSASQRREHGELAVLLPYRVTETVSDRGNFFTVLRSGADVVEAEKGGKVYGVDVVFEITPESFDFMKANAPASMCFVTTTLLEKTWLENVVKPFLNYKERLAHKRGKEKAAPLFETALARDRHEGARLGQFVVMLMRGAEETGQFLSVDSIFKQSTSGPTAPLYPGNTVIMEGESLPPTNRDRWDRAVKSGALDNLFDPQRKGVVVDQLTNDTFHKMAEDMPGVVRHPFRLPHAKVGTEEKTFAEAHLCDFVVAIERGVRRVTKVFREKVSFVLNDVALGKRTAFAARQKDRGQPRDLLVFPNIRVSVARTGPGPEEEKEDTDYGKDGSDRRYEWCVLKSNNLSRLEPLLSRTLLYLANMYTYEELSHVLPGWISDNQSVYELLSHKRPEKDLATLFAGNVLCAGSRGDSEEFYGGAVSDLENYIGLKGALHFYEDLYELFHDAALLTRGSGEEVTEDSRVNIMVAHLLGTMNVRSSVYRFSEFGGDDRDRGNVHLFARLEMDRDPWKEIQMDADLLLSLRGPKMTVGGRMGKMIRDWLTEKYDVLGLQDTDESHESRRKAGAPRHVSLAEAHALYMDKVLRTFEAEVVDNLKNKMAMYAARTRTSSKPKLLFMPNDVPGGDKSRRIQIGCIEAYRTETGRGGGGRGGDVVRKAELYRHRFDRCMSSHMKVFVEKYLDLYTVEVFTSGKENEGYVPRQGVSMVEAAAARQRKKKGGESIREEFEHLAGPYTNVGSAIAAETSKRPPPVRVCGICHQRGDACTCKPKTPKSRPSPVMVSTSPPSSATQAPKLPSPAVAVVSSPHSPAPTPSLISASHARPPPTPPQFPPSTSTQSAAVHTSLAAPWPAPEVTKRSVVAAASHPPPLAPAASTPSPLPRHTTASPTVPLYTAPLPPPYTEVTPSLRAGSSAVGAPPVSEPPSSSIETRWSPWLEPTPPASPSLSPEALAAPPSPKPSAITSPTLTPSGGGAMPKALMRMKVARNKRFEAVREKYTIEHVERHVLGEVCSMANDLLSGRHSLRKREAVVPLREYPLYVAPPHQSFLRLTAAVTPFEELYPDSTYSSEHPFIRSDTAHQVTAAHPLLSQKDPAHPPLQPSPPAQSPKKYLCGNRQFTHRYFRSVRDNLETVKTFKDISRHAQLQRSSDGD